MNIAMITRAVLLSSRYLNTSLSTFLTIYKQACYLSSLSPDLWSKNYHKVVLPYPLAKATFAPGSHKSNTLAIIPYPIFFLSLRLG